MQAQDTYRAMFCIGVHQNFMDAPKAVKGQIWEAFTAFIKGIDATDGIKILGVLDDDLNQVGPSGDAP
ncbi:MAG: hypothetical protein KTR17_03980 [Cellvibrionaceae bacterium]|nr:hypothetical protein [Cellvibrionaceae bacterium]